MTATPSTERVTDRIQSTARDVAAAARRTAGMLVRTELRRSAFFSERMNAEVFFKLENFQTTGSFKFRGATNKLLQLSDDQRGRGCVAASSGNHGAAVACAMQKMGIRGVIFVPEKTSAAKVEKIRGYGGDVRFFGTDGLDTEQYARQYASDNGMSYLSPYNDASVIAGQGTCGVEILQDLADIDAVFVAVGGGGLISGVGSVLKASNPAIRIIGCQPSASAVMAHSVDAGEILDLPSEATISDGTAGGIEAGAITFPLNQALVDEYVVVDEEQITVAMRLYMDAEGNIIEGAAGVAIAAMLARKGIPGGSKIAAIVCGGNISEEMLAKVRGAQ